MPSWLNPFDILIAFALIGGVVWGFTQGLVRMALSLVVLYLAVVLAMSFYVKAGEWIVYLSGGGLAQAAAELSAFLIILILTTTVVNFALARAFKETELPGIRQIDQLGGLVLGFVLVAAWIGLVLVGLVFVLNTPGVGSDAFRANVLGYMRSSLLVPIFNDVWPILLATLRPWMPRGQLPDIFAFQL
ncbi:MAG: CvpA family protein [Anaerolineae bacterium]|nr:CvpA family protein [Anaerolineae bacterium]